jgi:hypothetical protein
MMTEKLKQNWFWPVAAALWIAVWLLMRAIPSEIPPQFEYAVLADVFLTMPLLLWLCYRAQMPMKALMLRMAGVIGLGIWLASKLLAPEQQNILPQLGVLRNIGLGIVIIIELWLFVSIVKIMFKKDTTADALVKEGVPEFMAKLMLLEARFWRWVFGLFKCK